MNFDDEKYAEKPAFPCPKCGGNVEEIAPGKWECDNCDVMDNLEKLNKLK